MLLVVAGALVLVSCGSGEQVISTNEAEHKLRAEARRERQTVTHVQCVRATHLPRSFDCFVEGPDDMHLAYRVTVQRSGELVIRPPQ